MLIERHGLAKQAQALHSDIMPEVTVNRYNFVVPKFLNDFMLGKLNSYLRILGFDSIIINSRLDDAILSAIDQSRIFLTKRNLPALEQKYPRLTWYQLKTKGARMQIQELEKTGNIFRYLPLKPRCSFCNIILLRIQQESVNGRVPDYILQTQLRFWECSRCHHIYWPGSHMEWFTRLPGKFPTQSGLPD